MKILVVEDETALAEAVAALLRKEGYSVETANDGKSGLGKALSGRFDCMVLDIMLPGMNGLEVLTYMRVKGIEIPVLLLTAKSEVDDKIKGLDCGADDYLTKPFVTGELLARVRAMTRRLGMTQEINPKYGDISLDMKKGELCCGANTVVLGRKEFQMMEMLVSGAGKITTKEDFVSKIWGCEDDSAYNNVEVYISFLRKKLQLLHSSVQIKTRRGIGYCLEGA